MGGPDDGRDPLTGMNTSPERFYYDTDGDGVSTGSFGTQWQANDARDARARDRLQALNDANTYPGPGPNLSTRPRTATTTGNSASCLKTAIIGIVVVVLIIIVVIVLLSLLGNYAASHINQHA